MEKRREALLALIRAHSIGTQSELVERLNAAGFSCTQVSVSRDIRALGLVKRGGRYTDADDSAPVGAVSDLSENISIFIQTVTTVGDNLIVVKTHPGTAHSVALLVDTVHWPEVVGSVAGDDTVFLAISGGAAGCAQAAARLNQLIHKGR